MVCRVCFAVDVKMYDMKEFKLSDMFHNVTGILACSKEDSTLHRLCWECAARLAAAAAFRDKALFSDALLKDLTNIQLSDITSIKETYSSLNPSLTIQTVFTSTDIQCDDSVSDTNEAETLVDDDSDLIARNTVTSNTQEEFDEAWIGAPIKTEAEADPINDYNKADTHELSHTENKEEEKDKITGTITGEAEMYEVLKIIDTEVDLEDHEEEKSEPVENDDIMEEEDTSSSGEDTDELSLDEDENNMSSEVTTVERGNNSRANCNNDLKEEIIDLKQRGFSTMRVAYLLNTSWSTVQRWWDRWNKEGHMNHKPRSGRRKKTTPLEDQLLVQRVAHERSVHTQTLAKEFGISPRSVIRRLNEAGYTALLPKAQVPLRSGRGHVIDDDTKQKIVTMKLNGVSVTELANQFRVTRTSVYRWSRDIKINNSIENITDTTTEDQSTSEDSEAKESSV